MPGIGAIAHKAGLVGAYYPFRWLVRAMPREIGFAMGRAMGSPMAGRGLRKKIEHGIELFYGDERSEEWKAELLKKSLVARGAGMAELMLHDTFRPKHWQAPGWIRVTGAEHLKNLQSEGRGAVFVGLHLGPYRYIPSILASLDIDNGYFVLREAIHAGQSGRGLAEAVLKIKVDLEQRAVDRWPKDKIKILHLGGTSAVRSLRTELAAGRAVLINLDTAQGSRFVPGSLLGRRLFVPTGHAKLCRSSDAALVPHVIYRRDGYIEVEIGEPIEVGEGKEGEDESTVRTLDWLGPRLEAAPEQWWVWPRLEPHPNDLGALQVSGSID